MKTKLLILATLLVVANCEAQVREWLYQTNFQAVNTTTVRASDNVGIGTNAPQTKLDVNGNTTLRGSLKLSTLLGLMPLSAQPTYTNAMGTNVLFSWVTNNPSATAVRVGYFNAASNYVELGVVQLSATGGFANPDDLITNNYAGTFSVQRVDSIAGTRNFDLENGTWAGAPWNITAPLTNSAPITQLAPATAANHTMTLGQASDGSITNLTASTLTLTNGFTISTNTWPPTFASLGATTTNSGWHAMSNTYPLKEWRGTFDAASNVIYNAHD